MEIAQFLQSIVSAAEVKVLAALVSANFILGVLAAVVKAEITLADLMGIWKRILIIFVAYGAVSIVATVMTDFTAMRTVMWAALIAFLVAQIISNLKGLGLPIPVKLGKYLEK